MLTLVREETLQAKDRGDLVPALHSLAPCLLIYLDLPLHL